MDLITLGTIGGTFIAIATLLYAMLRNFKNDIKAEFNMKFDHQGEAISSIKEDLREIRLDIKELRTSVNRIEGSIYHGDACFMRDHRNREKAE